MIPLVVSCPLCGEDLMDNDTLLDGHPSVGVNLLYNGVETPLHLSSIYGSFRFDTPTAVDIGDVTDILCRHCSQSLVTDTPCEICKANLGRMRMAVDGDVFFCSRRGCKGHKVELRDLEESLAILYSAES